MQISVTKVYMMHKVISITRGCGQVQFPEKSEWPIILYTLYRVVSHLARSDTPNIT